MNPEEESKQLNTLITNPAFYHISQNILWNLDHETHLTFRSVCQSWRAQVDDPVFWIKKCTRRGQPKDLEIAFLDLLQRMEENAFLKQDLKECLMKTSVH